MGCVLSVVAVLAVAQSPSTEQLDYVRKGYPCFGSIVGSAGDVNGDGASDLIIGDPGDESDSVPPYFWILSSKDGQILSSLSLRSDSGAGYRVVGGRDVDGDRIPDIVIAEQSFNASQDGTLHIISAQSGTVINKIPVKGSTGSCGAWVRLIEDADGDGLADVVALDWGTAAEQTVVRLFSGKTGSVIRDIALKNQCGSHVGGLVWIGKGITDATRLYALLDGGTSCRASLRLLAGKGLDLKWEHQSLAVGSGAYAEIQSLGDIDVDGIDDVALSFLDYVDVISGQTGQSLHILRPSEQPEGLGTSAIGFGCALVSVGDIDKDEAPDILIAERESRMSRGTLHLLSGKTGQEIWTVSAVGEEQVYHIGHQLAALGDVDGDSLCDILVGTSQCMALEPGLAFVVSGGSGARVLRVMRKNNTVLATRL